MFSILRTVLIIGIIFYLSPVREGNDPVASLSWLTSWWSTDKPTQEPGSSEQEGNSKKLETMWQALPDTAKQAIVNEVLTRSGISGKPAPGDTLRGSDKKPAWRGEAHKPAG